MANHEELKSRTSRLFYTYFSLGENVPVFLLIPRSQPTDQNACLLQTAKSG